MKTLSSLLSISLLTSSLLFAQAQTPSNSQANDLDDLMTPDEIEAEVQTRTFRGKIKYVTDVLKGKSKSEVLPTTIETLMGESSSETTLKIRETDTTMAEFVVVVNKAAKGTTAQTLKAYHLGNLKYEWKISTGREKFETAASGRQYTTTTPVGYFRPTSIVRIHHSQTWNADMEYVVFFIGGIALHSTTPSHYKELGTRASGGCVRQTLENAKTIYDFIVSLPKKQIPLFDRKGNPVLNKNGIQQTTTGRDVMIIVQNVED